MAAQGSVETVDSDLTALSSGDEDDTAVEGSVTVGVESYAAE